MRSVPFKLWAESPLNCKEGMDQAFKEAFREVIREQVVRKNEVELDGLGTFRFEHRNQFQRQYDNGRVVMMPPRDTITFIAESQQR